MYSANYILNPGYKIKKDENCFIIFNRDAAANDELLDDISVTIHPLIAIFISMFDGVTPTKKIIANYSDFTSTRPEKIEKMLKGFLSKETIHFDYDDDHFHLPKNILVKNNGNNENLKDVNLEKYLIPYKKSMNESRRLNYPLDILMIINFTCLTDCVYCYADRRKKAYSPLSTNRIIEIIREAKSLEMRSFDFSGGEFFLHKDWKIIAKELRNNEFTPYLSTKIPIDVDSIKFLKDIGINTIQISLDSIDSDELIKMLNVDANYYSLMMHTIENLEKYGMKIRTNSQMTRFNEKGFKKLLDFLIGLPHIDRVTFGAAGYSLYKSQEEFFNYRPSLKAIKNFQKYADTIKLKTDIPITVSGYIEKRNEDAQAKFDERATCSGNFTSMIILPNGEVTVCEMIYWHGDYIIGDLRRQSILEVWKSKKAKNLSKYNKSKANKNKSICANCSEEELKRCREEMGICWVDQVAAYGSDSYHMPDPKCPKAPNTDLINWLE